MGNKIFYTVSKINSHAFATNEASKKIIGFITPDEGETFGYLVANGKQFGPSNDDILEMVKNNTLSEKMVEQMIYTIAPQVSLDEEEVNTIIGQYINNNEVIPSVSVTNGSAQNGKYISGISATGHKLTVTFDNLPTHPTAAQLWGE